MSVTPLPDPGWSEPVVTFERWRDAERVLLRNVARRLVGFLQEPGDQAMRDVPDEIRGLLVEWEQWRQYGAARGWQPPTWR